MTRVLQRPDVGEFGRVDLGPARAQLGHYALDLHRVPQHRGVEQ